MKRSITALELIKVIKEITEDNIQQVNRLVSKMSESQLNWNQNPGVWSVAQVLAHLNAYANYYHPTLIKKMEGTRFTNVKEDFVSSPLGKSAWKSMKLGNAKNVKRKFKAPKGYNPYTETTLVTGNEVTTFLESQQELLQIADSAAQVNLKRIKIPISISKIVRLRLGDALLFITYHNERHIQQIINLKKHPNFPRK